MLFCDPAAPFTCMHTLSLVPNHRARPQGCAFTSHTPTHFTTHAIHQLDSLPRTTRAHTTPTFARSTACCNAPSLLAPLPLADAHTPPCHAPMQVNHLLYMRLRNQGFVEMLNTVPPAWRATPAALELVQQAADRWVCIMGLNT